MKAQIDKIREAAQKFIDKVDGGRARSVETYADMKRVLEWCSELEQKMKGEGLGEEEIDQMVIKMVPTHMDTDCDQSSWETGAAQALRYFRDHYPSPPSTA